MYTVTAGTDVSEFNERTDAIVEAKRLSEDSRQPVIIRDEEERERMSYHNGELESYTYDTQPRRRSE